MPPSDRTGAVFVGHVLAALHGADPLPLLGAQPLRERSEFFLLIAVAVAVVMIVIPTSLPDGHQIHAADRAVARPIGDDGGMHGAVVHGLGARRRPEASEGHREGAHGGEHRQCESDPAERASDFRSAGWRLFAFHELDVSIFHHSSPAARSEPRSPARLAKRTRATKLAARASRRSISRAKTFLSWSRTVRRFPAPAT